MSLLDSTVSIGECVFDSSNGGLSLFDEGSVMGSAASLAHCTFSDTAVFVCDERFMMATPCDGLSVNLELTASVFTGLVYVLL